MKQHIRFFQLGVLKYSAEVIKQKNHLIECVRLRPCIWDNHHHEFKSSTVRQQAFTEIAEAISDSEHTYTRLEIQEEWNKIRCYFVKIMKRLLSTNNEIQVVSWAHWNIMQFMYISIKEQILSAGTMKKRCVIRKLLKYEYEVGHTVKEAIKNINRANGPGTVSKTTAYGWYSKFKIGNLTIADNPRPGRPRKVDRDAVEDIYKKSQSDNKDVVADVPIFYGNASPNDILPSNVSAQIPNPTLPPTFHDNLQKMLTDHIRIKLQLFTEREALKPQYAQLTQQLTEIETKLANLDQEINDNYQNIKQITDTLLNLGI
ncbi:alcohol dehydrogenase transcription factor myb/SANT-like domain-containing protein [Ditylenchus destructor]|nr:alcohol dehydrogenase transcription factor myb/SANT-like domain-containing protein [Ditylenchus destructor]